MGIKSDKNFVQSNAAEMAAKAPPQIKAKSVMEVGDARLTISTHPTNPPTP